MNHCRRLFSCWRGLELGGELVVGTRADRKTTKVPTAPNTTLLKASRNPKTRKAAKRTSSLTREGKETSHHLGTRL